MGSSLAIALNGTRPGKRQLDSSPAQRAVQISQQSGRGCDWRPCPQMMRLIILFIKAIIANQRKCRVGDEHSACKERQCADKTIMSRRTDGACSPTRWVAMLGPAIGGQAPLQRLRFHWLYWALPNFPCKLTAHQRPLLFVRSNGPIYPMQ